MADSNFSPRYYQIDNVELNWAKLVTPVSPFGVSQYELQIATTDATVAAEWRANHLNVKAEVNKETMQPTGKHTVSLKRKAMKADGTDNGAPSVVNAMAEPIDGSKLGNESRGNVIIWQSYYKNAQREGISNSLTSVQVTDFKEYTGGGTFKPIVSVDSSEEPAPSPDLFANKADAAVAAPQDPF